MTRSQAQHRRSPTVLWGVAWVAPTGRLMHPPSKQGNFAVLLMGAGPVDNSKQQGGAAGWHPDPAPGCRRLCERSTNNVTGWLLRSWIASNAFHCCLALKRGSFHLWSSCTLIHQAFSVGLRAGSLCLTLSAISPLSPLRVTVLRMGTLWLPGLCLSCRFLV